MLIREYSHVLVSLLYDIWKAFRKHLGESDIKTPNEEKKSNQTQTKMNS